jgi:PHD/YefM family antitoxin component YafN of YafNO toxin-antitoxin module
MKITNWEDYESLEEELAIKESRSKTNSKKKKKGYEKDEENKRNKKTGKLWSNHPSRI